jgi:hypothetical protein
LEAFKQIFGIDRAADSYGEALSIASISVVNQIKDTFGETQAIITVHKNCKLMLLTLPLYDLLIGLVLERWADADDDRMAKNIERFVADNVDNEINLYSISDSKEWAFVQSLGFVNEDVGAYTNHL